MSTYITEQKGDMVIVKHSKPSAEIEINTTVELRKVITELIEGGARKILVDFTNITYVDSSGLGVLIDAVKRLNEKGGELGILSISKDVLEVFTSTKIAQYFKFYKAQ